MDNAVGQPKKRVRVCNSVANDVEKMKSELLLKLLNTDANQSHFSEPMYVESVCNLDRIFRPSIEHSAWSNTKKFNKNTTKELLKHSAIIKKLQNVASIKAYSDFVDLLKNLQEKRELKKTLLMYQSPKFDQVINEDNLANFLLCFIEYADAESSDDDGDDENFDADTESDNQDSGLEIEHAASEIYSISDNDCFEAANPNDDDDDDESETEYGDDLPVEVIAIELEKYSIQLGRYKVYIEYDDFQLFHCNRKFGYIRLENFPSFLRDINNGIFDLSKIKSRFDPSKKHIQTYFNQYAWYINVLQQKFKNAQEILKLSMEQNQLLQLYNIQCTKYNAHKKICPQCEAICLNMCQEKLQTITTFKRIRQNIMNLKSFMATSDLPSSIDFDMKYHENCCICNYFLDANNVNDFGQQLFNMMHPQKRPHARQVCIDSDVAEHGSDDDNEHDDINEIRAVYNYEKKVSERSIYRIPLSNKFVDHYDLVVFKYFFSKNTNEYRLTKLYNSSCFNIKVSKSLPETNFLIAPIYSNVNIQENSLLCNDNAFFIQNLYSKYKLFQNHFNSSENFHYIVFTNSALSLDAPLFEEFDIGFPQNLKVNKYEIGFKLTDKLIQKFAKLPPIEDIFFERLIFLPHQGNHIQIQEKTVKLLSLNMSSLTLSDFQ